MSSFIHKVGSAVEKVAGHARSELIGIFDADRRHDDPDEIAADQIRQQINNSHRFQSFSQIRQNNFVKWHIDGHDYMWALSELLDNAKEVICILDWWLSPELYLRRPPGKYAEWRLDRVLKRKAEEGVKVHVIVYKEVTQTMSMSSSYTKKALEQLHPNITVLRHPDHIGSKDDVEFWSHHEKLVLIDNHYACIGGLDLCYGRWDTSSHPLSDIHPTDFSLTLFPGQDYNNARIGDFKDVWKYASGTLDLRESGRMPWHDVHMTLTGIGVLDLCQHFVERWNEVRHRKYRKDPRVEILALPHDPAYAGEDEAIRLHPKRETWHEMGRRYRQRWHLSRDDPAHYEEGYQKPDPMSCRVQVVRSVSDWSHGVLKERSIQNAYIEMINEANHFIYIENQFFISATETGGQVTNLIAEALVNRILRAAQDGEKFKVIIVIPEVPAFSGSIKDESSLKIIMAAQYRTINRGGSSIYEKLKKGGIQDPMEYIRFYNLRGYDRVNAPKATYLNKAEESSGVTYLEAQIALARQWIGDEALGAQNIVTLKVNEPGKDLGYLLQQQPSAAPQGGGNTENPAPGISGPGNNSSSTPSLIQRISSTASSVNKSSDKSSSGGVDKDGNITIPLPPTYEEAVKKIEMFERGANLVRGDEVVVDSVAHHKFDKDSEAYGGGLMGERWLGTEEEELDCYISELVYIHSKCMIVDDRRVIMGSANLNDRSQKGDGDSEIALVVEDNDLIKTTMNGKPYMAARFAATLRRKLFREHLGLITPPPAQPSTTSSSSQQQHAHHGGPGEYPNSFMRPAPIPNDDETSLPEDKIVEDPLSDEFWNLWCSRARVNREVFTEVFRPVPSNFVRDWNGWENYVPKVKTGHVVPGIPLQRVKERLGLVRGSLVEMPIDFLIDEKGFVEGPEWKGLNPTLPIYI